MVQIVAKMCSQYIFAIEHLPEKYCIGGLNLKNKVTGRRCQALGQTRRRLPDFRSSTYKSLNLSMKTYCGLPFESGDGLYGNQPEHLTSSSHLVQLWMSMAANHSKASKTFSSLPSLDP